MSEPTPETQTATAATAPREFAYFMDEGVLARQPRSGSGNFAIWLPSAKTWRYTDAVDPVHRAYLISRDRAAKEAGGEEYLDLPATFDDLSASRLPADDGLSDVAGPQAGADSTAPAPPA